MINVEDDVKKLRTANVVTKYVLAEPVGLDGAELIPIDLGGRLITHQVSINELGKQLLKASAEGNVKELKSLLTKGAPFTADWLGTSPLHLAAQNNHPEVCDILLWAGISKDARTKVDRTPLHMAAYEGHLTIVESLIQHNADIECKDLLGMTPLHWAVQNGHKEVAEMLIKKGAKRDTLNKFGLSPADIAAQINRQDLIDLVRDGVPDAETAAQNLVIQLQNEITNSSNADQLPIETVLMEDCPDQEMENSNKYTLENKAEVPKAPPDSVESQYSASLKILQEHGITMLPNEENNILSSVMESGHSVVLTDVGKEVLNSVKQSEQQQLQLQKQQKSASDSAAPTINTNLIPNVTSAPTTTTPSGRKIITLTADEFLAMTANGTLGKNNIIKQVKVLPSKTVKRIVMHKNKLAAVTTAVTGSANSNPSPLTAAAKEKSKNADMELLMNQLVEAHKTISEYKIKLMKKEQEAERYKQQVFFLTRSKKT